MNTLINNHKVGYWFVLVNNNRLGYKECELIAMDGNVFSILRTTTWVSDC